MESNKVEVEANVGGKDCYVIKLRLEQGFNSHHTMDLVVDYNDLDSLWMQSPSGIFELLGKDVKIEMKHRNGEGVNLFKGMITGASVIGHHGGQNHIRISGSSPTAKLDGSKTMDSFMDMTLNGIVSEAVGTSGNGGEVTPQPKFTGKIDYICQYGETCFEFLNRLSWIYGEWFFYDGQKCYFGKQDGKEEDATFESEITTFDLGANLVPSMMERYHYLVHDDRKTDRKVPDPGTEGYHTVVQGRSSAIYTSEATLPLEATALNEKELEDVGKVEKNRATFSMLTVSGTSQTSKVKIGGKIKVKLPENMLTTKKDVDTFLVTSVVHEFDIKAEYSNSFVGIPSTVENIPMKQIDYPKAYPQLAWVKENVDTQKRGRIKVQTQWQKNTGKTTNWIRVQTEDAGSSKVFAKNRGHVFIPEIDDQVMIDFEYGDPNRPYMTGAIFPENKGEGGKIDNNIKSIKTRSGHIIEFNDSEGKKSITVTDIAGNLILMDTVGEQMKIYAPKKVTIVSEDIEISASNSLMLSSGKDTQQSVGAEFKQTVGENHHLSVGDSLTVNVDNHLKAQTSTGNVNVQSGNEIIENAKSNVKITSMDKTDIISQSDITIQSGSDVFIAQ
ncbi:MAG: phage baseplate assembly protein V [Tannerella sp.]|jgi:uncharacterized protein involved in type VI secretion and phage assembly|nr:phage baseplate assembly protein V [Tannerella sp.]